jgi:hypothetical protein
VYMGDKSDVTVGGSQLHPIHAEVPEKSLAGIKVRYPKEAKLHQGPELKQDEKTDAVSEKTITSPQATRGMQDKNVKKTSFRGKITSLFKKIQDMFIIPQMKKNHTLAPEDSRSQVLAKCEFENFIYKNSSLSAIGITTDSEKKQVTYAGKGFVLTVSLSQDSHKVLLNREPCSKAELDAIADAFKMLNNYIKLGGKEEDIVEAFSQISKKREISVLQSGSRLERSPFDTLGDYCTSIANIKEKLKKTTLTANDLVVINANIARAEKRARNESLVFAKDCLKYAQEYPTEKRTIREKMLQLQGIELSLKKIGITVEEVKEAADALKKLL